MMLRTESDFILAANQAYDLSNIVISYLHMYRNNINGYNEVNVPDKEFSVSFKPSNDEGFIVCVIHWTDYHTYTETQYYDVDSDYFSESWGADNSCGETSYTEDYAESKTIKIPIKHLMQDKHSMISYFKKKKIEVEAEKKESLRKIEIEILENKLTKLKGCPYNG